MKRKVTCYLIFLLITMSALNLTGCSKLVGPSDQDVIQAVNESGLFKGGFGGLTLTSPIVMLEKGKRTEEGYWPVKAKLQITYYLNKDQVSAPEEKIVVFHLYKEKDSSGQTVWKAKLN
jgi:hypothetical protein